MAKALIELMAPIQEAYQASKEWQEIALKAYPPPPKKEKKVKDKGSRHPGAGAKLEVRGKPAKTETSETAETAATVESVDKAN